MQSLPENKIIILNKKGNVENEKDLIHREEKKGWKMYRRNYITGKVLRIAYEN